MRRAVRAKIGNVANPETTVITALIKGSADAKYPQITNTKIRKRTKPQNSVRDDLPEKSNVLRSVRTVPALYSIFLKNRSDRQVQANNSERPADENITRSARPIRFS